MACRRSAMVLPTIEPDETGAARCVSAAGRRGPDRASLGPADRAPTAPGSGAADPDPVGGSRRAEHPTTDTRGGTSGWAR
jgi:hypothetical protein